MLAEVVPVDLGVVQRRPPVLVLRVQIGAPVEQVLDDGVVAVVDRAVQRRDAVGVGRIEVDARARRTSSRPRAHWFPRSGPRSPRCVPRPPRPSMRLSCWSSTMRGSALPASSLIISTSATRAASMNGVDPGQMVPVTLMPIPVGAFVSWAFGFAPLSRSAFASAEMVRRASPIGGVQRALEDQRVQRGDSVLPRWPRSDRPRARAADIPSSPWPLPAATISASAAVEHCAR